MLWTPEQCPGVTDGCMYCGIQRHFYCPKPVLHAPCNWTWHSCKRQVA